MFKEMGEQRAKECSVSHAKGFLFSVTVSVSHAKGFLFSVTVSVEVSLGTKLAQLRGRVRIQHRVDTSTLVHICFPCHRVVVCT